MQLIGPPPRPDSVPSSPPADPAVSGPGQGCRLWLVRHGKVAEEYTKLAYGSMDVPLSEEGLRDTRRAIQSFAGERVDLVVSSDLERAAELGRGIAEVTGAPLLKSEALREICRGDWQGIERPDFKQRWLDEAENYWRDPWNWRGHGGDSDAQLFERAWPVLAEALAGHPGGTVVLTAHTNLIRVMLGRFLGLDTEGSYGFRTSPTHMNLVVDTPQGWELAEKDVPSPRLG